MKSSLSNSNVHHERGVIQITFRRTFFQKLNLAKDGRRYKINKTHKRILPFVTEYRPSVPNFKNILMAKWNLTKHQPVLRETFKNPPIVSYSKGRSLKDILVRSKLRRSTTTTYGPMGVVFGLSILFTIKQRNLLSSYSWTFSVVHYGLRKLGYLFKPGF